MPTDRRKIALYIRVSTISQSFEAQDHALREFCLRRGWPVDHVVAFQEKASGSHNSRPVLDQLMTRCRLGEFSTLVVYKLDRLGRDVQHLLWVMNELESRGVGVVSVTQPIDTTDKNPMGKLTVSILAGVAEFEKDLIRERSIAGQAAARAAGRPPGRPNTNDKHREKAQGLRKKGYTIEVIASKLNISMSAAQRLVAGIGKTRARRPKRAPKTPTQKHPPENQPTLALGV